MRTSKIFLYVQNLIAPCTDVFLYKDIEEEEIGKFSSLLLGIQGYSPTLTHFSASHEVTHSKSSHKHFRNRSDRIKLSMCCAIYKKLKYKKWYSHHFGKKVDEDGSFSFFLLFICSFPKTPSEIADVTVLKYFTKYFFLSWYLDHLHQTNFSTLLVSSWAKQHSPLRQSFFWEQIFFFFFFWRTLSQ